MTIQTPTAPDWPRRGVQWIQRGRPSSTRSTSSSVAAEESQRTFAVTPRDPSDRATARESRTRTEPPMRSRKRDCRIPGTRREGETKRMRREGAGRRRRYYPGNQSVLIFSIRIRTVEEGGGSRSILHVYKRQPTSLRSSDHSWPPSQHQS